MRPGRWSLGITALLWLGLAQAGSLVELQSALKARKDPAERLQAVEASEADSLDWPLEDRGRRLILLGLELEANHRIDDAFEAYDSAVSLLRGGPPGPALVDALLERSYITYVRTNQVDAYCPDRREALDLARQVGQPEPLANALVKVAFCYQTRPEDFTEALGLLQEAVSIAEAEGLSGDRRAMIYNATASVYRGASLHDRSYEFLGKAYALWAAEGRKQDMFNMLHTMVTEAMSLSREADAQRHVDQLFELAESSPEFADFRFFAHYNQGSLHFLAGRYVDALEPLDQALALADTTEERYFVSIALAMRAVALHHARLRDRGAADARAYLASETRDPGSEFNPMSQAVLAEAEGDLPGAVAAMWSLERVQMDARRRLLGRVFDAQARMLDERIASYDNRFLQQTLQLQQAELARLESDRAVARLTLGLAVAIVAGLLLAALLLWRSRRRLRELAQTDALTGLANRRQLFDLAARWAAQAQRHGGGLSMLLLDIDHFKGINDRHGHQAGDEVLRQVAAVLRQRCPAAGVAGRIGGEEFAVLLQGDGAAAQQCALALRTGLRELQLGGELAGESIRASIGVAQLPSGDTDISALYRRADEALYAAKAAGRDQVRAWEPLPAE
ncbi:MAG: GGDEF domain-containing protein [Xanthomonadales bacterium]|nr:GGDEF domain-containing protein [Xanthomonadales bacterium]